MLVEDCGFESELFSEYFDSLCLLLSQITCKAWKPVFFTRIFSTGVDLDTFHTRKLPLNASKYQ